MEADVDRLIDVGVLQDERYPTYGHDTRHAAARSWYMTHKRPLLRRTAQQLIEGLAAKVSGANPASVPFLEALGACIGPARELSIDGVWYCLLYATYMQSDHDDFPPYAEFEQISDVALQRNPRLIPIIAAGFNTRGLKKMRRGDLEGALADFNVTRRMDPVPADEMAFALCNSGHALCERGQPGDFEAGIAVCTAVLELPEASTRFIVAALNQRGTLQTRLEQHEAAIADLTTVIRLTGISTAELARAHNNRGSLRGQVGDPTGAIADFSAVLELSDLSLEEKAKARFGRGLARYQSGDREGATTDFTAVIGMPDPPALQLVKSLGYRGVIWRELGFHRAAIADCTAVIEHPQAPAWAVIHALTDRGAVRYVRRDYPGAIADCTAVIQRPDSPNELLASAYLNRGLALRECDTYGPAIGDFVVATRIANAPSEIVQAAQECIEETEALRTSRPRRIAGGQLKRLVGNFWSDDAQTAQVAGSQNS